MREWITIEVPEPPEDVLVPYVHCRRSGDDVSLTLDFTIDGTSTELAQWLRSLADAVEASVPWVDPDAG